MNFYIDPAFYVFLAVAIVPAAVLAIVIGALIDVLQKHVMPRGLRKGVGK